MFGKLVPSILSWMIVVIILALAPTIVTYNGNVTTNVTAATNAAYMIGMTTVDDFGGFIMIIGMLFSSSFFALSGMKSKNVTIGDMLTVIGSVIMTVVALAIFSGSVIGYIDALITAGAAGFEKTAYGILSVLVYVMILGGSTALTAYKAYKARKGSRRSRAAAGSYM